MHEECYLNLSLSEKLTFVLQNLQNYEIHLIFLEIGKCNFKTNFVPKTRENYKSFTIQQLKEKSINPGLPLVFIDRVHF